MDYMKYIMPPIRVAMAHNFTESKRNSLTVINFMFMRFNMYHALAFYVTCRLVRHFLFLTVPNFNMARNKQSVRGCFIFLRLFHVSLSLSLSSYVIPSPPHPKKILLNI